MSRNPRIVRARRVAGVLGGLGVGVAGGFVGSLLRGRPPTVYAGGLESAQDPAVPAGDHAGSVRPADAVHDLLADQPASDEVER